MVSDMVGRGSFHRHIVTSGGRIARPARTAQPDSDRKLLARPAVQTAETQTAVTVVLRESSCIFTVYGPALYGAVPECTSKPQGIPIGPLGPQLGAEEPVPSFGLCDRELRTAALFATVCEMTACLSRTIPC